MITCPHCAGLKVETCCLCHGTRRVDADPSASAWLWAYRDCKCDTCAILRGQRRVAGQKAEDEPPRPELAFGERPPAVFRGLCACGNAIFEARSTCNACSMRRWRETKKQTQTGAHHAA